jgi:hypothetical protein
VLINKHLNKTRSVEILVGENWVKLITSVSQVVLCLLGGWVYPSYIEHLLTPHSGNFLECSVLRDGDEECVDHAIGVSLAALAGKAAMKESRVNQQLPNRGVAPEVRNLLRPYLDPEVVMTTAKHRWSRVKQRLRYAYHILSKLFESLVKSHFVL